MARIPLRGDLTVVTRAPGSSPFVIALRTIRLMPRRKGSLVCSVGSSHRPGLAPPDVAGRGRFSGGLLDQTLDA